MTRAWISIAAAALCAAHAQNGLAGQAHWPQWRGPALNGVAPGDAPLDWSGTRNVSWKIEIPGRGFSSPIVWGDKLFLTTAVPTGKGGASPDGRRRRRRQRRSRRTPLRRDGLRPPLGKTLWQQTATTATPHEGYHRIYGSFASNNPATDGRHVYAFFGSRGLFAYDMNGKEIWKRDFNQRMKMHLQFGEGSAVALHEGKLITVFDHHEQGLLAVTDAATGKELWSIPRTKDRAGPRRSS